MIRCIRPEVVFRSVEPDNVNVHRAAAKVIVSKSRAARGSVCNVLLFGDWFIGWA